MPTSRAARPAYKSLLLVSGLLLISLGIGNWVTGAVRSRPYREYLSLHPGPARAAQDWKTGLLEPPDEEREQRDVTRAKLEFYQLVQGGGRLMVLAGAVCMLAALANRRRGGAARSAG